MDKYLKPIQPSGHTVSTYLIEQHRGGWEISKTSTKPAKVDKKIETSLK